MRKLFISLVGIALLIGLLAGSYRNALGSREPAKAPSPAPVKANPNPNPNRNRAPTPAAAVQPERRPITIEAYEPERHIPNVEPVPILMYHEIGDNPSQLYVSRENFQAQMKYLKDNGYHTVTLDQIYRHFESQERLPPKPVAVSFDDGYRTIYTEVYPVFKQYGFVGTFFVFPEAFGRPNYVTWDQVIEMSRAGQSIQSHTRGHVDLTRSSDPQWRKDQLVGSKGLLEQKLGQKVNFLAYPGGFYNRTVMEATRQSGYLAAVTTEEGWASGLDNRYAWKRVRVFRRETVSSLAHKLQSPNYARTPRVIKVRRNVVTD